MNRPPNPHRDEHRRLTAEGNAAAGRGDYERSQRLWKQAAGLKAEGQLFQDTDALHARRESLRRELANVNDALLTCALDFIRLNEGAGVAAASRATGWSDGFIRKQARAAGIEPSASHAHHSAQMKREAARRRAEGPQAPGS